nr:hypothetical protein [Tanacetum cinerariifolium]
MDDSRSTLSRPRPDAVTRPLTLSLDRSRRCYFFPATPSPRSINNTSSWIWCSKFDETGKGVIFSLYVDMLIFGTDQVQVDLTKEFLSLRFSLKDIRDPDVILGIRIKHESNGIAIFQSHYIEKVVSQLEYSRVIGCLMYAMTCTRSDIAFAVDKLSRYTDASWISNTEDNSSTSGCVFLLSEVAISWAFKKQTCITGSIIESKFMALAIASKKAEWLRNLIYEIPL